MCWKPAYKIGQSWKFWRNQLRGHRVRVPCSIHGLFFNRKHGQSINSMRNMPKSKRRFLERKTYRQLRAYLKNNPSSFRFLRKYWTNYDHPATEYRDWNRFLYHDPTWFKGRGLFSLLVYEFIKHGISLMKLNEYLDLAIRHFRRFDVAQNFIDSGLYSVPEISDGPVTKCYVWELRDSFVNANCRIPALDFVRHDSGASNDCYLSEMRVSFDSNEAMIDSPRSRCTCQSGSKRRRCRRRGKKNMQNKRLVDENHVVAVLTHRQRLRMGV